MLRWKKNLPEKQFYSMNIKPRLEDPINLFHYLQHLSVFFLWSLCQSVCVCVRIFLLQATNAKKRILVLLKTITEASLTRYGCVSANILNWGGSTATNVKHDCVFPLSWKSAWNHVCPFCFTAANCDGAGTVTAICQEACLELTDLLVRVSVCLCTPQLHLTVTWVVWSHGG